LRFRTPVLVLGVVVAVGLAFVSRSRLSRSHTGDAADAATDKRRHDVHVPRLTQPLVLDGELDEAAWHATPVTKFLGGDGKEGHPYNDIRFMWSNDGILHVGIYASDINIVTAGVGPDGPVWRGDSFHVVFANADGLEHSFDIGPVADGGVLTDGERKNKGAWNYAWQSGARLKLDMDEGTVDNPSDNDEEWVIEMEIPLASLGLKPEAGQQIDVVARRCDVDCRGGPPLETPCPETDILGLVFDP
jgi:hypothetical protein